MQTTITSQPKDVVYTHTQSIKHITAVAQRQRAGLITPRSPDRNGSAVVYYSPALKKLAVKLDAKRSNFIPVWRSGSALLNSVFYLYTISFGHGTT